MYASDIVYVCLPLRFVASCIWKLWIYDSLISWTIQFYNSNAPLCFSPKWNMFFLRRDIIYIHIYCLYGICTTLSLGERGKRVLGIAHWILQKRLSDAFSKHWRLVLKRPDWHFITHGKLKHENLLMLPIFLEIGMLSYTLCI